MRHTASHFTKLDSCQQRVCSPDPLYAKYIQYHVWKQCCFEIQLCSLPCLTDYFTLPTLSPLFWFWLTSKLDCFVFVVVFLMCVCPLFFLLLSFPLSLSISFPAHSVPWYRSCTHLMLTIGPQFEGWQETMVYLWGLHPLLGTVEKADTQTIHTVSQDFFFLQLPCNKKWLLITVPNSICLLLHLHIPIMLLLCPNAENRKNQTIKHSSSAKLILSWKTTNNKLSTFIMIRDYSIDQLSCLILLYYSCVNMHSWPMTYATFSFASR